MGAPPARHLSSRGRTGAILREFLLRRNPKNAGFPTGSSSSQLDWMQVLTLEMRELAITLVIGNRGEITRMMIRVFTHHVRMAVEKLQPGTEGGTSCARDAGDWSRIPRTHGLRQRISGNTFLGEVTRSFFQLGGFQISGTC